MKKLSAKHMAYLKREAAKVKCPACQETLEKGATRCSCGLPLHTEEDCQGCSHLKGKRCSIFKYTYAPILRDDGTCQARELAEWRQDIMPESEFIEKYHL